LFDDALAAAHTPAAQIAAMSELLRRAARLRDPAADRYAGDAWRAHLDAGAKQRLFDDDTGALLIEGAFRAMSTPTPSPRCATAHAAATWSGCSERAAVAAAWFDTLAWPYALCALPLPLLARWLLPRRRSASAALRVPYGERIDHVAEAAAATHCAVAGPACWHGSPGPRCASPRRVRKALGPPIAPPQVGRDLMLAVDLSGSMSEEDMELGGQPVDRLTAAKAVLADFLDRRAGIAWACSCFGQRAIHADAAHARPHHRAPAARRQRGRPGRRAKPRSAMRSQLATKAPAIATERPARGHPAHRWREYRGRCSIPDKAAELAHDAHVRVHTIAFGGEGGNVGVRLPPADARRRGSHRRSGPAAHRAGHGAGASSARATPNRSPASTARSIARTHSPSRPGGASAPGALRLAPRHRTRRWATLAGAPVPLRRRA
jgi:Ca-activated chloride channel family protein